jgi:alanine-glyoxylate transaminase/serine-glyoxylate transaminase/serine-pyruvate transaminase
MTQPFGTLNPAPRLLLGPGPSQISPRVLRACTTPLLGYLDPQYLRLMDETQELLRYVLETKNEWTFCAAGTGMAGMEAAFINMLEPGDEVMVCIHGAFGERMAEIAKRGGAKVTRVDAAWGTAVQPEQVAAALKTAKPKVVAIVHGETSTGVLQPLEEIGALAHQAGALFLVDCVTTLGGIPVQLDARNIDITYSATQKCLGAPPSLSPMSLNAAAVAAFKARKTPVQSFYLDLGWIWKYWGADRAYHQTGMINMIYALREALLEIKEEGLAARYARHRQNQRALLAGLVAMGLQLTVADPAVRLPSLTTVMVPAGADDKTVRGRLLNEYGIEIGGGLGQFAGKAWRIGLMGYASQRPYVMLFLTALGELLKNERVDEGLAAAAAAYAQ